MGARATCRAAHKQALQGMTTFAAQALVVSLGLDTFAGDPISGFTLRSEDYLRVGVKPVNVLEGFEQQAG